MPKYKGRQEVARMVEQGGVTPEQAIEYLKKCCGAGHLCCDDPTSPPLHDHFLTPEECPRCLAPNDSSEAGNAD